LSSFSVILQHLLSSPILSAVSQPTQGPLSSSWMTLFPQKVLQSSVPA
jgi:hypothetical protein